MEEHWLGSKGSKLPVASFNMKQLTRKQNTSVMNEMILASINNIIFFEMVMQNVGVLWYF